VGVAGLPSSLDILVTLAAFTRKLTGKLTFADPLPARKVKKAVLTSVVVSSRHARLQHRHPE
jgi:hypothetical protein